LDNKAPLGAGYFCAPDLLLAKSGFGGLNNTIALGWATDLRIMGILVRVVLLAP